MWRQCLLVGWCRGTGNSNKLRLIKLRNVDPCTCTCFDEGIFSELTPDSVIYV